MRKGRIYGTIVVDLERRRVVDLLPDRTAETLAELAAAKTGDRDRPLRRYSIGCAVGTLTSYARDLAETRSVCGWLNRVRPRRYLGRAQRRAGL